MAVNTGAVVSATTVSASVVETAPDWCVARTLTVWLPG